MRDFLADLPAPLTSLVDREHEVETLVAMLRDPDTRLLTLTGRPVRARGGWRWRSARQWRGESWSGSISNIYTKTGLENRREAVEYARRHGL